MKNLRFILIAAFSLMLTATSCKKEKAPEPTPAAAAPVVTYSTFNVDLACVDITTSFFPGTFSGATLKAYSRCGTTILDSIVGIPLSTDGAAQDPCAWTTLATVSKSFKTQDGSTNYIDVYEGSLLLATAHIVTSPANKIYIDYRDPTISCYNYLGCPTLLVASK